MSVNPSVSPPVNPPANPLRPQPARSLLAACGGAPPPGKPLSNRQAACLHWSAAGKTSWETSRILGVSESTVNFHLRNACAKLGVRGRRAAVVAALRLGLLDTLKA